MDRERAAAGGRPGAPALNPAAAAGHYLDAFAALHGSNGRSWVAPLRRAAIERFAALGFPTTRQEAWRRTSVAPITSVPFQPQPGPRTEGLTPGAIQRFTFEPWECSHVVFINGHHAPALTRLRPLPPGVVVTSLRDALERHRDLVEPHLGRLAGIATPFAALNTAFLQDGVFVHVPRGVALDEAIHLVFVAAPDGAPVVSYPRNLVVAGEGSHVTLVESHVPADPAAVTFTDTVTEIVAGAGAVVVHCKLQREGRAARHVATIAAEVGRSAAFSSYNVALGAVLARNDINVTLAAEGAQTLLDGLYVAAGEQLVDNHTSIDHLRPHGSSNELYKGVLDGHSRGVFDGRIVVHPDAQKTDAHQVNRNLLLSEDALVDTKPQLEIRADDVKCTHGATIGQLDEDALFYLKSRAIGGETARQMLIQAFVADIVHRIPIEPIRAGLDCLLFQNRTRMHRGEGRE